MNRRMPHLMHGPELGFLVFVCGLPGLPHQLADLAEAGARVRRLQGLPLGIAEELRTPQAARLSV